MLLGPRRNIQNIYHKKCVYMCACMYVHAEDMNRKSLRQFTNSQEYMRKIPMRRSQVRLHSLQPFGFPGLYEVHSTQVFWPQDTFLSLHSKFHEDKHSDYWILWTPSEHTALPLLNRCPIKKHWMRIWVNESNCLTWCFWNNVPHTR